MTNDSRFRSLSRHALICIAVVAAATGAISFLHAQAAATEQKKPAEPALVPADASFPIRLNYTLKEPGAVVIAIDGSDGHRVRNLIADVSREAGERSELWDGRDDAGQPVKPGKYRFKGAVTPKIDLTYEFTVNNSGTPPWWKQDVWEPRPEPGGWMSDHAPPLAAAAVGDKIFLGAESAEHGHSIIAVDTTGRKLWGAKWLELSGARCVTSDGKTVFVAGEGSWIGQHMKLFAIDPTNFAVRRIADFAFDAGPLAGLGGLSGLAARDGKIYAAFNPPHQDVAASALDPAALDLENTTAHGLSAKSINALLRCGDSDQPWINLPLDAADPVLRFAWKSDQTIGTICAPQELEVAALKPKVAYPGDLKNDAHWVPIPSSANPANEIRPATAMNVYVALPGSTRTRALRVRVKNQVPATHLDLPQGPVIASNVPPKTFIGMHVLRSRLTPVTSVPPKVEVSSGAVLAGGAWENVQRDADITPSAPAIYTMRFKQQTGVAALIVRDPLFAHAAVEIQRAPNAPWARLTAADGVSAGGDLAPTFPWRRAYGDLIVDLGRRRTISGLRLVIYHPATAENADVKKRTGNTARTCSLGGVVLLDSGGEAESGQRIGVIDAASGQIDRDIPVQAPSALAFTPSGELLAVSNATSVVRVPLDPSQQPSPIIQSGLTDATGLTCDAKSKTLYISDAGEHAVKRFTLPDFNLAGVVGKPGGIIAGPYDPQHMSSPHGICIDSTGKLWVAESEMRPKKVSVWDLTKPVEPKLDRYYIGGPRYGCGFMFIDPREPSRFFFEGMEFAVDWKSGTSTINNIPWRAGRGRAWDGVTCDRPVYLHDRLYLVGEPFWFYGNRYFAIARYESGKEAVPAAAAGKADEWPPLRDSALRAELGNPDLSQHSFLWSDRNDNGRVEAEEVKISPKGLRLEEAYFGAWCGGSDLTLQFTNGRFSPTGFTPGGAPLYDFDHMTPMPQLKPGGFGLYNTAITSDGSFIEISDRVAVHDAKGEVRWSYPDRFNGVHGSMKAPPPQPGMLIGTLHVIGHATFKNVGEVFAVMNNKGEVYVFTVDGLYIARLFQDNRLGKGFNLPAAERGMSLNHISLNTEHFGGTFNQLSDGRVFMVAGHNHNSVIRVDGLDRITRFDGSIEVSAEQSKLAAERPPIDPVAAASAAKPKVMQVPRAPDGVTIDGDLAEWSKLSPTELKGTGKHRGKIWLAYDPQSLLIAARIEGSKGMTNREKDFKLLFRAGDCIDVQLSTTGDRSHGAPQAGDLRLLISRLNDEPTAVLYRPLDEGTPAQRKITFASPVATVTFDAVEKLDLPITVTPNETGYTLEAAIPWKTLRADLKPAAGMKLRGDVGVLFADDAGLATAERIYWSNADSGLVADIPGEARLQPDRWGTFELQP